MIDTVERRSVVESKYKGIFIQCKFENVFAKCQLFCLGINVLTLKHQETHGCVVSTVATDALVLKHQAISIHNAD